MSYNSTYPNCICSCQENIGDGMRGNRLGSQLGIELTLVCPYPLVIQSSFWQNCI